MERYEYADAVKAFEQAAKLAPDSVEIRIDLAIAMYNRGGKGDLERCEALLDAALAVEPDNVRARYFRGIAYQYRGQDEQAIGCFDRVVKLVPHDAVAWYLLARSKVHLGQPCRAELERAVKENPGLVSAYYDLMRIARQEGDVEQARAYQEMFVKLRESPLSEMVVMPHYRRMGRLAVVRPMSARPGRNVAGGELSAAAPRTLLEGFGVTTHPARIRESLALFGAGAAMAEVNGDGHMDLAISAPVEGRLRLILLLGRPDGTFVDATKSSGLATIAPVKSCAFGDYDNDDKVDLFVGCVGANHLFRGRGDGTFEDVTVTTGAVGLDVATVSAVFLDADHDGDLDIYVCNDAGPKEGTKPTLGANQLLNNNADGTFSDITAGAGVGCPADRSTMMAPIDLDDDRDTDLVVFGGGSVRVFFNDRLGKYHEGRIAAEPIRGPYGGVAQDFNGDGRADLLISPGVGASARLVLSDGTADLEPSTQFDDCLGAIRTWGEIHGIRVADVDLDGDLDVAIFGQAGHVLLNDGWGRFVVKANVWPQAFTEETLAAELVDLTGDGAPDLLRILTANGGTVELVPTKLTPPANWLAVTPTGDRGDDKRTRSPASGFGTRVELRCGLHSQVLTYTGLNGGFSQSQQPLVFGLNGAGKADYVTFTWPDGVTQCENELAARTHHRISEMERRVSSCPVLFAWNGERFGFVGDFAGVGGLGYYLAPGEYAAPRALEHVKIEPRQLAARDGFYELRVCEPMEEVAYVDRLELVAVDHPAEVRVYPDERLAITGSAPTHRLLCVAEPIFPVSATAPDGTECAENLTGADRLYAYQPKFDRRFCGFCEPHALVLDFGDRLTDFVMGEDTARAEARGSVETPRVYLFLNGWIEYPYSQTTYAAAQAGVIWQPMKIERLSPAGDWKTVVPDAGAPGGMARTIAIDLTGRLADGGDRRTTPALPCKLRISTNLEIYYDQAFIAVDRGTDSLVIRSMPVAEAELRRLGFPLEYSPDGHHPTVYTYDVIEPTSSFKIPAGAYTRYGSVAELLTEFDDRYVILGTGDEIAVRFDARSLSPPGDGMVRSFVLVSHAYCKDMDLYTAEPDTVAPLPFRTMGKYPYAGDERYPDDDDYKRYQGRFNTRLIP